MPSHKQEKKALHAAYRQLVNRFYKKVEKSALPEAERARRHEQDLRRRATTPTLVVPGIGKPWWRRGKAA